MPKIHEEVHQRTGEEDQEGQEVQQMLPVIGAVLVKWRSRRSPSGFGHRWGRD
jgi:hypothetical protein